jgi:competence protein ComEA
MLFLPRDWRRRFALLAPLVIGAGILAGALTLSVWAAPAAAVDPRPGAPNAEAVVPAVPAVPGLLVHVSGAVANPGIYRLNRGDRVTAAIAAAGGVTAAADQERMPDLAGRLRDGQQVKVPSLKGSGGTGSSPKADLNTATAEELATVPGFTPDLALEVLQYRDTYGPFTNIKELVTALGMSQPAYVLAKSHVRV